MTTEQLPAGPELDAAVQRAVWGSDLLRIPTVGEPHHWVICIEAGKVQPIPPYSTSIKAAWKIVEAFPSCCFHIHREHAAGIRYDVIIIMDGEQSYDHGRRVHATAATAALAICRAALSAVAMAPEGER